ncbi:MAG: hypothetical protein J6I40_08845 [Mailhella sp.]|nr:hypothetical protein [Mailhella sp.]
MNSRKKAVSLVVFFAGVLVMIILVFGTVWIGQNGKKDTESAVRSVSLLYLNELTERREQVVADNLKDKIKVIETALELMTADDLSDMQHLQAYQAKMKRLFKLEKFAFVNADGLIYTSLGTFGDIDQYHFDYLSLAGPEISIKQSGNAEKKVIIAVPVNMVFAEKKLTVCFMEIDMKEMLKSVSMGTQDNGATFCNLYTAEGFALSNTVLGGLAVEDNLLKAIQNAELDPGYSHESMRSDFKEGKSGEISFSYSGIRETLSYTPVEGTNWLLTYLIRESVISDSISPISKGIIRRGVLHSILMVAVLLGIFAFIIRQNKKTAKLVMEKETADAENRVKQEEMGRRIALQEKLLAREKKQEEQNRLITALASDYRSVYYLDLDRDEGVCYQAHDD